MKRYRKRQGHQRHAERSIARKIRQEEGGGFRCSHCKQWVVINEYMGTANRNHCNICLWSKHVDIKKGDRRADCQGGMRPIGLTFRTEVRGEIMLIHECATCAKLSINRIAADDREAQVILIFEESLGLSVTLRKNVSEAAIYLAGDNDRQSILDQLYGHGQHTSV